MPLTGRNRVKLSA